MATSGSALEVATHGSALEVETLRERLLNAALAAFGDKGYSGARVEEIASLAGASKQALYHHFGSKEGIFSATVEESYRRLRHLDAKIKSRLKNLEPRAALRDLMDHLFTQSSTTDHFQRILHDENRFKAIHTQNFLEAKQAYSDLIEIIRDALERGQKSGVFRAGIDPKQLYIFLAGVLVYRITNAYTLSTMLDLSLHDEEEALLSRRNAIEMIIDALRPIRT